MATVMPAGRAHPSLWPLVPPLLLAQRPGCVPGGRIGPLRSSLPHPAASSHPHPAGERAGCHCETEVRHCPMGWPGPRGSCLQHVFSIAFKNKIPAIKAPANFIPGLFFPGSCRTRGLPQPHGAGSPRARTMSAGTGWTGGAGVGWSGGRQPQQFAARGGDPSSSPCRGARNRWESRGSVCGAGSTVWRGESTVTV